MNENIEFALPYLIIATSLVFLTLMTLKYLKLLLENDTPLTVNINEECWIIKENTEWYNLTDEEKYKILNKKY